MCTTYMWGTFTTRSDWAEACDCPYECELSSYIYKSSMAEYPTRHYAHYLKNNPVVKSRLGNNYSFEDLKQSIAQIDIYYEELKETIVKQEIKTLFADLVASVGGTLGLFLGLSFLSFVELIEIVIQVVLILSRGNSIENSK